MQSGGGMVTLVGAHRPNILPFLRMYFWAIFLVFGDLVNCQIEFPSDRYRDMPSVIFFQKYFLDICLIV